LVIRYSFLWSDEAQDGAVEGSKDRPCAIVVAAQLDDTGGITVVVAPITHSPPEGDYSLEIPPSVSRTLKLDGDRHWIRIDELNEFVWPGFDLRQIPGGGGDYAYGLLPKALYQALRAAILDRRTRARPSLQKRD
jgi:hypothetical protein